MNLAVPHFPPHDGISRAVRIVTPKKVVTRVNVEELPAVDMSDFCLAVFLTLGENNSARSSNSTS